MGWLPILCLLCTLHLAASAWDYLLPDDVIPSHYDVRLAYDIDPNTNHSFYGVVDILLSAKRPTSKIVLHAQDFHISKDIRLARGNSQMQIMKVLKDKHNKLTIALNRQMGIYENYSLTIPFYGYLQREFDGAYISSYFNTNTKDIEYLITTHFEPLGARRGFPCFDEPIYKATFRITIGHHRNYSSISNMPLVKCSEHNALEDIWPWHVMETTFRKPMSAFVFDQFDVSVPMSTYLVAYVVSKYTYRESPASLSTAKFRTWSRSDAYDQTSYAAIIGPKILTHYEKWFNVSFPLPKLDMITIPDFAMGGMENWGLITYQELSLLYDKKQTSLFIKDKMAEVIAHELAHQWFGNLVTMKWWSDLWLNEGFATFVASIGVAAVEPTWNADRRYAANDILAVLSLDALESSHPVSVPIDDPNRIFEIFDPISYSKGATLIRMMTMFLGEKVFRQGIHNYLIKYSYRNAEQDDLWLMLTEVSQQYGGLARQVTVKEIMDTWTTQIGYPLLTVTRDYNDSSLTITQKRYISLSMRARTSPSWWVPLSVKSDGDSGLTPLEWLARDEGILRPRRYKHDANKDQWLLFNYDMIAPYRVSYDQQNWKLLSSTLRSSRYTDIPMMGRVQLLSDAFALAKTNHLDYDTTIELSSYLSRETEFLPLNVGLVYLDSIGAALKRTIDFGVYQKYLRRLIEVNYHRSGGLATKNIIGDNMESVMKQVLLSKCACLTKVRGCEENAIQLFQRWMDTRNPDKNNPIPLDLRNTVYRVAIVRGSESEWYFALARMQHTNSPSTRAQLLKSLGYTRDLWIISQFLEMCVTEGSVIRPQEAAGGITSVLDSPVGYYIAKHFIYNRIEDILNFVNGQSSYLSRIISGLLAEFTTQQELDEFMLWRERHSNHLEPIKLGVEQAIETTKVKIDWINRNRRLVVEKLTEFSADYDEKYPLRMFKSFHAQTQLTNKAVLLITLILLYAV